MGNEVLVRSSNQPQSSYATAASLTEFELKKIIIDKIEANKSMHRSDVQMNLYNTLIEEYNSNKDLLESYGEVVTLKRSRKDQDKDDKDEEPSAGSNRGSKRRCSGNDESSKEPAQKESKSTSSSKGATRSTPKSSGNDDVNPATEVPDMDERLWNPSGSRTPDREWNLTKTVDDRPPQQWMIKLA
ncbi:hypothetical protein Tco_0347560 [Tanacetum coccineum]|uniref:Uncharacterized protein n=1 Tax=Tanacetum coccineum TaxID=301880 RepID=A0ABQ5DYL7_9ASTR